MKKTTLICLLDKKDPPDHSFVTGMLAQALPEFSRMRVQLAVMPRSARPGNPSRYHRAVCLPVLPNFTKAGESRLVSFYKSRQAIKFLIKRAKRRGGSVMLFVRNHPLLLLVAASLRGDVDRLIYQNSFPLENSHRKAWKRAVHRNALKLGCRKVDAVLAVSPLGLERTQRVSRAGIPGLVVPLFSDLPAIERQESEIWSKSGDRVRFIYIGTHVKERRLDVVLQAIVSALESGLEASFAFIGGQENQISELRSIHGVTEWERRGAIIFHAPVRRDVIPGLLASAECGLSLVPANAINREMSPTKLAEYFGAGLPVLASRGVELQEEFVKAAEAGLLVDFDVEEILIGIKEVTHSEEHRIRWARNALTFSRSHLRYEKIVDRFSRLISG